MERRKGLDFKLSSQVKKVDRSTRGPMRVHTVIIEKKILKQKEL